MGVEMEDDHLNLANTDKSHELGDQQHLKIIFSISHQICVTTNSYLEV